MKFNPESVERRIGCDKWLERIWEAVRMIAFPCSLFNMRRWRIFWLKCGQHLSNSSAEISWRSSVARLSRIDRPWNVSIGDCATICNGAWLYALNKIMIGRWAIVGEDVKLLTGTHDVDSPSFHLVTAPICIGDMAWIATGAIVLPGVTIGEGAVVGAGAVVTKSVAPWTVVAGNPAKVIRQRTRMEL